MLTIFRIFLLASAILLCSNSAGAVGTETAEALFARVAPTVWMIKADRLAENATAIGSAVLVTPEYFVTACHVVESADKIDLFNGAQHLAINQVIRDPDPERDLCLLRYSAKLPIAPAVVALTSTVKVGQHVYVISSPRGLELSLTDGLVSALRASTTGGPPVIQTSTPVAAGSSGGGLFDAQGRLIGVVKSVATNTENFAFSNPAEWISALPSRYAAEMQQWSKLLSSQGVHFNLDGSPVSSGFASIADVNALPSNAGPKAGLAIAYHQFLLLSPPRAFVLTSDGKYGTIKSAAAMQSFQEDCANRHVTCKLYAVDSQVVWRH